MGYHVSEYFYLLIDSLTSLLCNDVVRNALSECWCLVHKSSLHVVEDKEPRLGIGSSDMTATGKNITSNGRRQSVSLPFSFLPHVLPRSLFLVSLMNVGLQSGVTVLTVLICPNSAATVKIPQTGTHWHACN